MRAHGPLLLALCLAACAPGPSARDASSPAADAPSALVAINDLRGAANRAPLQEDARLARAAAAHARDMARTGSFDHRGSDGSGVGDRVRRAGYDWCRAAENIAQGQSSVEEVMASWTASPGHRRNMLDPRMTDVAVVEGPERHWVMVLARPC